jgi:hypothetical protein
MACIPYFAANKFELLPARHISDSVLYANGRTHALCSKQWLLHVDRWITVSDTSLRRAVKSYEIFDGEKFKNLRLAYEAAPNLYDLVATIISACVSRDAPSIGELLIKWTTLINLLKRTRKAAADNLIQHFYPELTQILVNCECRESHLLTYIKRLIPIVKTKYHIAGTIEQQCMALSRHAFTSRSYTDETSAETLTPGRLHPTWHTVPNAPRITFSWTDFFTPMFYANTGGWHMRYAPVQSSQDDAEPSEPVSIIGSLLRNRVSNQTHESNVSNYRHITSGDSLNVKGTPLYMYIPPHQMRPTVHQVPYDHFNEGWRSTTHADRGQPNSPLPTAMFSLVGTQTDVEGEIYLKPGKDFAFCHYLGYADWISNNAFKHILDDIGPNITLPLARYSAAKFADLYAFSP